MRDPSLLIRRSFAPLLATLRGTSRESLARDLMAGVTVAAVEVPQAMAYALVAGVPPHYGLYASVVHGLVGAVFSSNERLSTGPTNSQSLLAAAIVARLVGQLAEEPDPALYLELVFALALLKGLFQLGFAAARMGTLVRYVSQSVIVGFSAGVGVLIAIGQLPHFLGLAAAPQAGRAGLGALAEVVARLGETDPRALAIGAGSLALLLGLRRLSSLLPGALLALGVAALAVQITGWGEAGLALVGDVGAGWPEPGVPLRGLGAAELLVGGALALAALGSIETVAIGRAMASRTAVPVRPDREIFAQGLANAAGAFVQCIPGSGSFTRSALLHEAGARTRLAGIFQAVGVAVFLALLGGQIRHVPLASLAAILLVVAFRLVDLRYLLRVVRTLPSDALVCVATFLATLLVPLHLALFLGIFLNGALYLRESSRLHMSAILSTASGTYVERPLHDALGRRRVLLLQFEGSLFFGVADELRAHLDRVLQSDVRAVVIRLKRTHALDATVLHVLEAFATRMRAEGRHVILCGVTPGVLALLRRFGLVARLGEANVFETGRGVFSSAQAALRRAAMLAGAELDQTVLDAPDLADGPEYEI
jgi:sulfate permease, SulP family